MNQVIENIQARRSIRKYSKKKIPKTIINQIIEAGMFAPSSHNSQPWKFIIIENQEYIKNLSEYIKKWFRCRILFGKIGSVFSGKRKEEIKSAEKRVSSKKDLFFYDAPLLVMIYAKQNRFSLQDCSLAASNMMLFARSLGIGSCWIGFADMVINKNRKILNKLGVPIGYKVMAHLIFGYPDKFPENAYPRKESVVKWIK
ncbi:MAG: nitroreductase family protein [Nanoarchaeota archaeon]